MTKEKLNMALEKVEMTYHDVNEIAHDMLKELFDPINELVSDIRENVIGMPPETIRNYMIRLQLKSYEISETKEKSALKAECAEALKDEKYAESYNAADGTTQARANTALLASSEEVIIEALYNLVANLLKTKLDELHRLISVLQSILMSKMQEAKLAMNSIE